MAAATADDRTRRVLVVDDEAGVLRFVDRVLREQGYETALASGSAEALALLDSGASFDLLLTDLVMPGMCGDELARIAVQRMPALKVLYLTGFPERLSRIQEGLWTNQAFIEKPVSVIRLRDATSELLFGHNRGPNPANQP
jgi:two-component system cell cycle sensor histidine kinase/response regulator CckA